MATSLYRYVNKFRMTVTQLKVQDFGLAELNSLIGYGWVSTHPGSLCSDKPSSEA